MAPSFNSGKDFGPEKLTAEGTFIWMYTESLKELRSIWLNPRPDGDIDRRAFMMQVRFLINSIPDPQTRARVKEREHAIYEKLRADEDFMREQGDYVGEHASLEIVTEVIEFLCNAFELTHADITGPATSKQYKDSLIEIPDDTTRNGGDTV